MVSQEEKGGLTKGKQTMRCAKLVLRTALVRILWALPVREHGIHTGAAGVFQ